MFHLMVCFGDHTIHYRIYYTLSTWWCIVVVVGARTLTSLTLHHHPYYYYYYYYHHHHHHLRTPMTSFPIIFIHFYLSVLFNFPNHNHSATNIAFITTFVVIYFALFFIPHPVVIFSRCSSACAIFITSYGCDVDASGHWWIFVNLSVVLLLLVLLLLLSSVGNYNNHLFPSMSMVEDRV